MTKSKPTSVRFSLRLARQHDSPEPPHWPSAGERRALTCGQELSSDKSCNFIPKDYLNLCLIDDTGSQSWPSPCLDPLPESVERPTCPLPFPARAPPSPAPSSPPPNPAAPPWSGPRPTTRLQMSTVGTRQDPSCPPRSPTTLLAPREILLPDSLVVLDSQALGSHRTWICC